MPIHMCKCDIFHRSLNVASNDEIEIVANMQTGENGNFVDDEVRVNKSLL